MADPFSMCTSKYVTEYYALIKNNYIIFALARPVRDVLPVSVLNLSSGTLFTGCHGGADFQYGEIIYLAITLMLLSQAEIKNRQ